MIAPARQASGAASTGAALSPERQRWAVGGTAAGTTILATCLCSMDKIVFGAAAAGMLGTRFGPNVYTGVFMTALALLLAGLALRSRSARWPAFAGVSLLAAGLLLSPPSVMHGTAPAPSHLAGFGVTILGMAAVVWAVLRAFPTRRPGAAGWATGGLGAAIGCACCVTSGAVVGLGVALGLSMPAAPFQDGIPYIAFMAVALYGLYRLGGRRYALLGLAGAVIAFGGDEGLKPLLADEIELLPRVLVTLLGSGIVVWAFVKAFAAARPEEPAPVMGDAPFDRPLPPTQRERERELVGVGV